MYNYVGEPNSNLLCCICRMPFIEPVTTRTCAHTFCSSCIAQAISHARQCPVDRSALSAEDLLPANPIIRSLVDELIVECIHHSYGCSYTCQRQLLTAHVLDVCMFSLVSCPKGECDQTLARRDAESHKCSQKPDLCGVLVPLDDLQHHIPECDETTDTCSSCFIELSRSDLASHSSSCPAISVPCSHASNGCGWSGPRTDLQSSHLPSCPYQAIQGFFALNNTKFAQIAQENLILRHKVDTLESHLQTMRGELQSAKAALGPWYRPDGVYHRPSSDLPTDLQPSSASTSRRFGQAVDAPPPFDHHAPPQDILAAYFPSELPDESHPGTSRGSFERAARRNTLPTSPPGWEPFARPATQHALAVAPLDLSTTLEGSLAGVRDSVVALGSALDSVGRRADIALTNETVRLNEEVMSLRANIHGLRMQVHTIMMERNAQVTGRNAESDGAWPLHGRFFHPQTQSMSVSVSAPGPSITKL